MTVSFMAIILVVTLEINNLTHTNTLRFSYSHFLIYCLHNYDVLKTATVGGHRRNKQVILDFC